MNEIINYNALEKELYSAVIADILDDFNVKNNLMHRSIIPLSQDMVVMGRAFTILATDVYQVPAEPYKLEIESVEKVREGELIVSTTNGSEASGFWGELLSTYAMERGCRGAIVDGLIRDSKRIIKMKFPLFARGMCAYDSKGRTDVIAYQVPIMCGGVMVYPGDLIFADVDGTVVIPQSIENKVIAKALDKVHSENTVRKELLEGAKMKDLFEKYGIL